MKSVRTLSKNELEYRVFGTPSSVGGVFVASGTNAKSIFNEKQG
jgi:hypothetical protein